SAARASGIAVSHDASSVTASWTYAALSPWPAMDLALPAPVSASMSASTTAAPPPATGSAIFSPRPRAPAGMRTLRPLRSHVAMSLPPSAGGMTCFTAQQKFGQLTRKILTTVQIGDNDRSWGSLAIPPLGEVDSEAGHQRASG